MRTVGKIELDLVEMLICSDCETVRDPEEHGLVLKECKRDDCGEKAAVDPSDRECPSCNKQSLSGKIADYGCDDCQGEMNLVKMVLCDTCGEPIKPECNHEIVIPE